MPPRRRAISNNTLENPTRPEAPPAPVLTFDFTGKAEPGQKKKPAHDKSGIKEAIIRWLDEQL